MVQNLNPTDIEQWLRQAPPEQVIQVTHKLLDTISGYPQDQRNRFSTDMKRDTRAKLFEAQTV